MSILMWDKPKKTKSVKEWKDDYGFDGGPDGGYQSNMSENDKLAWKAKVTGTKLGAPQVEIRKTFATGSQVVIIVNLGQGYNYKYYRSSNPDLDHISTYQEYIKMIAEKNHKKYPSLFPTIEVATNDAFEHYTEELFENTKFPTKGINVHLSTNGPIQMTFDEMDQMKQAVEEAKNHLENL